MPINLQRLIIILILLLIFFLFISQVSANNKSELTFTIRKGSALANALIVGTHFKPIVNPRSISTEWLLTENEFYKEAQEAKKLGLQAKYFIAMEQAKGLITRQVIDYAKKNEIASVFEEVPFFQFLRTLPDFKDKTDEELKKLFDITDDILRAEKEEKDKIKKKFFPRGEFKTTDPAASPFLRSLP